MRARGICHADSDGSTAMGALTRQEFSFNWRSAGLWWGLDHRNIASRRSDAEAGWLLCDQCHQWFGAFLPDTQDRRSIVNNFSIKYGESY
jgi:hypothetical protein